MPFVKANIERVGGGLRKLFIYDAVADTAAQVAAANYFNGQNLENEIDRGDVIIVTAANNTTVDTFQVTSLRGVSPVTVSATEGVTVT